MRKFAPGHAITRVNKILAIVALGAAAMVATPAAYAASVSPNVVTTRTASAAVPAVARTGSMRARDVPGSYDNLYFCDYSTGGNIAAWEWPGGGNRSGNTVYVRVASPVEFNSIPWISSVTVNGQRWIYGAMLIPSTSGIGYIFGWVGRDYLTIQQCGTTGFASSNILITGTHYGDPFASQPAEISAPYRGQTWVWGEDPYSTTKAGWVGSDWLTLDSCTSSGCYYTINTSNIRAWIEPGGDSGP
jgi:hypothetical protein